MSAWKLATRALFLLGGVATAREVDEANGFTFCVHSALTAAARYGLVQSEGRRGGRELNRWSLTAKGLDWCEHRLRTLPVHRQPQGARSRGYIGLRFLPTWLSSLPRGVRLPAGPLHQSITCDEAVGVWGVMNCKPNDLAEIVSAPPECHNLIGVRIVVTQLVALCNLARPGSKSVPYWFHVTMDGQPLRTPSGRAVRMLEDKYLRPIRPDDEPDAVPNAAGKPATQDQIAALRQAMKSRGLAHHSSDDEGPLQ